jgi:hypothetical protein
MGYRTYHSLTVYDNKLTYLDKETVEHEMLISKFVNKYDGLDEEESNFSIFEQEEKWYDHEKNMKEYSLLYPDLIFKIHGDGEENEDFWDEYFKNGKCQFCPSYMFYDDYDESKLK